MNTEKIASACCNPGRKPAREPFDAWTLMSRFEFPIILTSLS